MQTALTSNNKPEAIGSYFSLYRELLTAQHYVCLNTGKLLPLTLEKKVVWCWMIDRYTFFKNQNKSFFDNQADIASACGVSESTVKRFLTELTDAVDDDGKPKGAGYIKTTCTRSIGGHKSNSYVLLGDLVLVPADKAANKPAAAIKENPKANAPAPAQNAVEEPTELSSDDYVSAGQDWALEPIPYADDFCVSDEQEDDGSIADAYSYDESQLIVGKNSLKNDDQSKALSLPTPKVENDFNSRFAHEMPTKKFNPNGSVSSELREWCKDKGIIIRYVKGDWVFTVDSKQCTVDGSGFQPYIPTSKTYAERQLDDIPEPF